MLNNDKIFSCEKYTIEEKLKRLAERRYDPETGTTGDPELDILIDNNQSQESNILEKIQIGFGAIVLTWCLFIYVIIPIYRKTPLYKYLLKRKEIKEKELSKKRENEYNEKRKAEDNAFEQIKDHPEIKRLQSEITRTLNLANKFGKTVVPILKKEISKIDPKHHIDIYECEDDMDQYDDVSVFLWDMCVDVAKAIQNKEKVEILVEQYSFSLDGLKQYTLDESYNDSDNIKFNEIFNKVTEDVCNKMNIPMTEYEHWKGVNKPKLEPNKIYYEKTWGGDHHGTVQSLLNMVVLDFSK